MMRRWADAPGALSLLAPRSPQRRPSGSAATLRPLPTPLREGPSSEWAWLSHQSTSPHWTGEETGSERGWDTPQVTQLSWGRNGLKQLPASQMLPVALLLTAATSVTLQKATSRGLQDSFPNPCNTKVARGHCWALFLGVQHPTQGPAKRRHKTGNLPDINYPWVQRFMSSGSQACSVSCSLGALQKYRLLGPTQESGMRGERGRPGSYLYRVPWGLGYRARLGATG